MPLSRQPLQATTGNSISRPGRNRIAVVGRQKNAGLLMSTSNSANNGVAKQKTHALSLVPGRENQGHPSRKRHLHNSKSADNTNNRRGLLGGVLGRFQRSNRTLNDASSVSSGTTRTTTGLVDSVSSQHGIENYNQLTQKERKIVGKEQEHSQTEATLSLSDEEDYNVTTSSNSQEAISSTIAASESLNNQQKQQREDAAATHIQRLYRGYSQRYSFQMLQLRSKLQQIEATKERQLKKIAQRTKHAKKAERSSNEFRMEKKSRRLMRTTHVIPYLFREAQSVLQENVRLAMTHQHLVDLQTSDMTLQCIAHDYLESMEDIPGIWEALKAQWMGPKKMRVRRGFGPSGKAIKLGGSAKTQDQDLPRSTSARRLLMRRKSVSLISDSSTEEERQQRHEGLLIMAELYLSHPQQVEESVVVVQSLTAASLLN